MFLGALLDAGLSRRALAAELAGLELDYKLVVRRVMRGAVAARHDAGCGVARRRRARHSAGGG